ncbi:hypothetical protein J132_11034 [Termitomyces sp. J132]|nr:hypothetical protein J132_11034 [Termitomyces sp. J132]
MSHSAAKVWLTLKDAYGTASDLGANLAENALQATKYSDGMDFQEHTTNLQSKWNTVVDKGAEIKDNQFRAIVISLLPASWDYIIASLQLTKTSIKLIMGLNVHWERLKEHASSGPISNALLAKTPQPQKRLMCTNPNCGRMGHLVENCYWKGGGKEGQFPTNFGRRRNATPSQSTPQTNQQNPTANMATMTTTAPAREALLMYADSGATDHCFVRHSEFEEYKAYTMPQQGISANRGGVFSILREGIVRKTMSINGQTSQLIFKSALHTPDLSANLISIGKFDDLGFSVVFKGGWASFVDSSGRTFMTGEKKN